MTVLHRTNWPKGTNGTGTTGPGVISPDEEIGTAAIPPG